MGRWSKIDILWHLPKISFLLILLMINAAAVEQPITDGNRSLNESSSEVWKIFDIDVAEQAESNSYVESTLPELNSVGPAKVTFNLQNDSSFKEVRGLITANDTAKSIILKANDANGSLLKYEIIDQPAHGNLSGTAPNLVYLPEKGYSGNDSFSFSAEDENGKIWNISAQIDVVQLYHPPSVRIRSPRNGMIFTYDSDSLIIPIHVTASGEEIEIVEIYVDGELLETIDCSGANSCPVTTNWYDPLPGKYTLMAKATDSMGVTCTSLPVVIIVNPSEPRVKITSPANGQIFTSPATINLVAQAEGDSSIEDVAFYANSKKIGYGEPTETETSYQFEWDEVIPGVYNLAAIATDEWGNSAISEPVLAIVVPPRPLDKADLAITLVSSPNPVRKRGNLNYYLTVTNRGPSSATDVFVDVFLPEELGEVKNLKATQGEYDELTGTWEVGSIKKYHSARLVITVKVPEDAKSGQIACEAEVAGSVKDPINSNNNAITYTRIR